MSDTGRYAEKNGLEAQMFAKKKGTHLRSGHFGRDSMNCAFFLAPQA